MTSRRERDDGVRASGVGAVLRKKRLGRGGGRGGRQRLRAVVGEREFCV